MALTREISSAQLLIVTATLTTAQPWAQLVGSDIERRGAVVYVDPKAPGPAWLADTEQHAKMATSGAPFYPGSFPPGFELGCGGGIWAYARKGDLSLGTITVYCVAEVGQATDHNA